MTRMLILIMSTLVTLTLGLSGCATSAVVSNSVETGFTQSEETSNEVNGTRKFASEGPAERFSGYSGGGGSARIK